MHEAACRGIEDPDIFFPEKGQYHLTLEAQTLCLSCPVIHECSDFRNRIQPGYGVWAGSAKRRGEH